MVKTYSPTVVTNHENSTIKMNGKNVGKLSASGDYYQKKLDPVIAGRYTFSVSANLSGKTISPSPVKLDLFSNHQVSLNITTGSFTVSSVPNGEVYINDKKVADMDDKGLASSEDAADLLQNIWDDNDSEDWVNGSSNTGYLSIKKLHDNWDDSDSVSEYNEVVSVLSTSPAGSGKTYANYTVTHNLSYTGDKDDTSVTDTYQNRIISQDSDGDYVLEKLGTPNAK